MFIHDTLSIFQYNIRKNKNINMISLLNKQSIKNYDIIAIQKLWRNEYVHFIYNSKFSEFHLTYCKNINIKICLYINEKIDIDIWTIMYSTSNIIILKILIKENQNDRKIFIHNVYNSKSIFFFSTNNSGSLSALSRCLTVEGEHIVLENFNLHHSWWKSTKEFTQNAMIDNLINIYKLIHLTKSSKNFNMSVTIKIDEHGINSKPNVKILKIQINTKLK